MLIEIAPLNIQQDKEYKKIAQFFISKFEFWRSYIFFMVLLSDPMMRAPGVSLKKMQYTNLGWWNSNSNVGF